MSSPSGKPIVKKLKELWADRRTYPKRLLLAGAPMLAACFTFIFFGPLEMVAFSGASLSYSYTDVIGLLGIVAAVVFIVGTLLIALLRGRIFNYVVTLGFSLTLAGYLQAAFFNGSLSALTGDAIDWHHYMFVMLVGFGIWIGILLVNLFIMYISRKIWKSTVTFVSLLLVIMQLVPTFGIIFGGYDNAKVSHITSYALTDEDIYDYSENENIFVFVLDRLDYDYIQEVLDEKPDFFNRLDGFTGYTNAMSAFARTQPALNHMLTGADEMAYVMSSTDYYTKSWTESEPSVLAGLQDAGYEIDMYTHLQYLTSDVGTAEKYFSNVSDGKNGIEPLSIIKKLARLSIYRYAPTAMKPFFWADTNYYNTGVFKPTSDNKYYFDDGGWASGFKTATATNKNKNFKFYHFFGSHSPYNLNSDGTKSTESTTVKEQTEGCFNILYSIFDRMKDLGIYEDATIIITADHGAPINDWKPVQKATRIGLFYKPSGSAGTAYKESSAPVCTENIPATIIKATGADYSSYGRALDDIGEDEEITRYYYKSVMGDTCEEMFYTYEVTGNAADFNNWKIVKETKISNGSFY